MFKCNLTFNKSKSEYQMCQSGKICSCSNRQGGRRKLSLFLFVALQKDIFPFIHFFAKVLSKEKISVNFQTGTPLLMNKKSSCIRTYDFFSFFEAIKRDFVSRKPNCMMLLILGSYTSQINSFGLQNFENKNNIGILFPNINRNLKS